MSTTPTFIDSVSNIAFNYLFVVTMKISKQFYVSTTKYQIYLMFAGIVYRINTHIHFSVGMYKIHGRIAVKYFSHC